jgi:hypothetical protein
VLPAQGSGAAAEVTAGTEATSGGGGGVGVAAAAGLNGSGLTWGKLGAFKPAGLQMRRRGVSLAPHACVTWEVG